MSLFNFRLKHPDEIDPWGREGNYSLHWFGLTDGEYWIDLGNIKVYEYSPDIRSEWNAPSQHIDYQISRFVEDLFHILPSVHISVPDHLFELVNSHSDLIRYLERHDAWVNKQSDDDTITDEFIENTEALMSWISSRHIDSMHMINGPHVWLFRNGERIRILWHTEGTSDNGSRFWSADSGQTEMNYADFINEVEIFKTAFFDAMKKQVEICLRKDWGPIRIDLNNLQREQVERQLECKNVVHILKEPPSLFDWTITEKAIRELL